MLSSVSGQVIRFWRTLTRNSIIVASAQVYFVPSRVDSDIFVAIYLLLLLNHNAPCRETACLCRTTRVSSLVAHNPEGDILSDRLVVFMMGNSQHEGYGP